MKRNHRSSKIMQMLSISSAEVQDDQVEQSCDSEQFCGQPSTSTGLTHSQNIDCRYNKYRTIRTALIRYETQTSDEDFDSDDSIFDKDYIPPKPTAFQVSESDTDSDIYIPNSQQVIVPETPEKSTNNGISLVIEPVTGPIIELGNEPYELAEKSNLTKKGIPRKRKRYETSLDERKKQKRNEDISKKYTIKPGCDNSCRKKCKDKIAETQRIKIHDLYWKMTWKEQRYFIINNTSCEKPVKIKVFGDNEEKKNRSKSIKYFLTNETGAKINVCKIFFLTTLGYCKSNEKVVRNAVNNKDLIPYDGRGHNQKKHKIDHHLLQRHIETFKPTISHYRREHAPNKRYLSSEITIQFMFDDFLVKHPNEPVSYDLYRKVIKDMNISFAKLGHEECEICELYQIHNSKVNELRHRKCSTCMDFDKHKERYTLAREKYDVDRKSMKSVDVGYFSADLQKVIMLPRIDMFKAVLFCPRLVVFHESFVPLGHKTSDQMTYAVIWHEAISGRKKDDIASAFRAFLKQYRDLSKIILWLDNCAGQNKNWALFSFLIYWINSEETATTTIILKYFEVGHTFMSADEFHHQVEHALKKKKKVYDFEDFAEAVTSTNNRKTIIKKMEVADFFNIADDTSNAKIQKCNPRPYLRDMVEVCFQRGSNSIFYKCSFNSPEYTQLDCLKQYISKRGLTLPLQKTQPRGIATERKNNILHKLVPLMPPNRKMFWENLPVNDAAANLSEVYED